MPGPDYLQFRNELYHHGILGMHWGIRRFQPYPKGYRGDGKYTGDPVRRRAKTEKDIKRRIDKGVKRTDVRDIKQISNKPEYVKNQIASNVRKDHELFSEKSKEIKDQKDQLNKDLYDIESISKNEIRKGIDNNSKLIKKVQYRIDEQGDPGDGIDNFIYYDIIKNKNGMKKWFPETEKKMKEIEKHQDDYRKTISNEIDKILDNMKGIGSERISGIKNDYVTYNDIVNQIIKRKLTTDWYETAESNIYRIIFDEFDKALDRKKLKW